MKLSLDADLERLQKLTFTRQKQLDFLLREIHRLLNSDLPHEYKNTLRLLRRWILCPYTLWPNDYKSLGEELLRQLDELKRLDDEIMVVMQYLDDPPADEAQELIAEAERLVKRGSYDLYHTPDAQKKYKAQESKMKKNFPRDWERFTRQFNVEMYYDKYRVIRRTPVCERNIRLPIWERPMNTEAARFQFAFDGLCARHQLYGVLDGAPLLQKLTVNPTAFGVMIFIPTYWSFDPKRDLKWKEINKLQKARCIFQYGAKSGFGSLEYDDLAINVARYDAEAVKKGLKGEARHEYVCEKAGLDLSYDPANLRRIRRHGEELMGD